MKKILVFLIFIAACSGSKLRHQHGTNPQHIAGFLNFKTYKPKVVEYDLKQLGDGKLGPADYTLEAVLYFDAVTYIKLRQESEGTAYTTLNKSSKDFNFKWLPESVKDELAESGKDYTGHPGVVLSSNPNCTLWFLKNKVLVHYFTM